METRKIRYPVVIITVPHAVCPLEKSGSDVSGGHPCDLIALNAAHRLRNAISSGLVYVHAGNVSRLIHDLNRIEAMETWWGTYLIQRLQQLDKDQIPFVVIDMHSYGPGGVKDRTGWETSCFVVMDTVEDPSKWLTYKLQVALERICPKSILQSDASLQNFVIVAAKQLHMCMGAAILECNETLPPELLEAAMISVARELGF